MRCFAHHGVRVFAADDGTPLSIRFFEPAEGKARRGAVVTVQQEGEAALWLLDDVGCDIVTLGQYLRPSKVHLPIARYLHPDEFVMLREEALALGIPHVEAGPLVRSSYHADGQAEIIQSLRARAKQQQS